MSMRRLIKPGMAMAAAMTLGAGVGGGIVTNASASGTLFPVTPPVPGVTFTQIFAAVQQGLIAGLAGASTTIPGGGGFIPFAAHDSSSTPVPQFSCCPGSNTGGTLPPLPDDLGPPDAGIHHGNLGGVGSGIQNGHIGGVGSGGHYDANGNFVLGS